MRESPSLCAAAVVVLYGLFLLALLAGAGVLERESGLKKR